MFHPANYRIIGAGGEDAVVEEAMKRLSLSHDHALVGRAILSTEYNVLRCKVHEGSM